MTRFEIRRTVGFGVWFVGAVSLHTVAQQAEKIYRTLFFAVLNVKRRVEHLVEHRFAKGVTVRIAREQNVGSTPRNVQVLPNNIPARPDWLKPADL